MGHLQALATFVAAFGLLAGVCHGQNLQMLVKIINRCPGPQYSGLPIGFEKLTYSMKPESGNIMINGFAIIRRQIDNVYMLVDVHRCISEDANSCQKFVTLNCTNMCKEIRKAEQVWTTFVDNMKGFPESCPLPAGRYEMDQAYVDLKKAQESVNLPPGNWMVTVKLFDQEDLLTCYYALATVKPIRKRKTKTF